MNGYTTYGMQTFDQSLMHLVKNKLVSYKDALKYVSNVDDFALRFRGVSATSDSTWDDFEKDEAGGEAPEEGEEEKKEGDDEIPIERF